MSLELTQKPEAIIFDLDGTLIEGNGVFGMAGDAAKRMSHDKLLAQNGLAKRPSRFGIREMLENFFRGMTSQPPKEGAIELLHELKEQNIPVLVVSTGMQPSVRKKVAETFGDLIDINKVYGINSDHPAKPSTSAYLAPLAEHGISTEDMSRIMVVGDTVSNDLEPAVALGMQAVYLNDHGFTNQRIEQLKTDGKLDEIGSLKDIQQALSACSPSAPLYINSVTEEETAALEAKTANKTSARFTENIASRRQSASHGLAV